MIVFIHKGFSWYVYYAVKQARKHNPAATIILITDHAYRELKGVAEVVQINQYCKSAFEFQKVYRHFSANSYEFELFCFQRWFVLRDYLASITWCDSFWHLDTDVLLYCDLVQDETLDDVDVALCGHQGPYVMGVQSRAVLDLYCTHVIDLFKNHSNQLENEYSDWRKISEETAVSDMHGWHTMITAKRLKVKDLHVIRQRARHDSVSHASDGYKMNADQKEFIFQGGIPYAELKAQKTAEPVRFKSIHCQGAYKHMMLRYFRGADLAHLVNRLLNRLIK